MESKGHKTHFWTALATVNAIALVYATNLALHADNDYARIEAAFALIAIVFLLFIGDAIGVLIAYWL